MKKITLHLLLTSALFMSGSVFSYSTEDGYSISNKELVVQNYSTLDKHEILEIVLSNNISRVYLDEVTFNLDLIPINVDIYVKSNSLEPKFGDKKTHYCNVSGYVDCTDDTEIKYHGSGRASNKTDALFNANGDAWRNADRSCSPGTAIRGSLRDYDKTCHDFTKLRR